MTTEGSTQEQQHPNPTDATAKKTASLTELLTRAWAERYWQQQKSSPQNPPDTKPAHSQ